MPTANRTEQRAIGLTATPADGLVDEPLRIRLGGIPAGARVTLQACMRETDGTPWTSQAEYLAKFDVTIDVSIDAPQSGTYAGVDGDGLIASLAPGDPVAPRPFDSNSIEPLTLYRRVGRPGNTSIVNIDTSFTDYMAEPPVEPFEVASVRVDDLAEEFGGRVDFLKIDVEGAEPLVLSGAERVIEQNPDLNLVMEWSPGQIRAAGFDVGDFLSHIDALKLRPSVIMEDSVEATDRDALLGASYHTGILLRR